MLSSLVRGTRYRRSPQRTKYTSSAMYSQVLRPGAMASVSLRPPGTVPAMSPWFRSYRPRHPCQVWTIPLPGASRIETFIPSPSPV